MSRMLKILFLDDDGAREAAMAEAAARLLAGDRLRVAGAGIEPAERIAADVEQVLSEIGINLAGCAPRGVQQLGTLPFDLVVTVTPRAREYFRCLTCLRGAAPPDPEDPLLTEGPVFLGAPIHLHWSLPEAEKTDGDDPLDPLRAKRDAVVAQVGTLLNEGYLDALTEQRRMLDSLVNTLDNGLVFHDEHRRIALFNRAAERITGYRSEDVLGKDCHLVFPPDGLCGSLCSFDMGPPPLLPNEEHETTFTTLQGEDRRIKIRYHAMNAATGQAPGVLAVLRDVTEVANLRWQLSERVHFHGMVGASPRMREVFEMIRQVTASDYPVLITGESGTGKELVAHAIHHESRRRGGPFVAINCGALPEHILESELFGHVRGAFTGAIRDKKGRFELADKGTIFLDEVGEISPAFQVKLLRVLQEKRFELVGSEKTVSVDVRVIAATNRNLLQKVQQGAFREDLYYRLCVVPIELPPLREREADIPLLVDHILKDIRKETGKELRGLTDEAMDRLLSYPWPGNVRELINALRFAAVRSEGERIELRHLPPEIRGAATSGSPSPLPSVSTPAARRRKLDREAVLRALAETRGNKLRAARLLGVGRATLYRFLNDNPLT